MKTVFVLFAAWLWLPTVFAADAATAADVAVEAAAAAPVTATPDSRQIELDLQRLPWGRFKAVIESIPKLKADVDAYGAFGWDYVRAHYTHYRWRNAIDKLGAEQRLHLVELIQIATGAE